MVRRRYAGNNRPVAESSRPMASFTRSGEFRGQAVNSTRRIPAESCEFSSDFDQATIDQKTMDLLPSPPPYFRKIDNNRRFDGPNRVR